MNDKKIIKRGKGRPKNFDRDKALSAAMSVFCKYGYQGASLAELSKEMGMNPPSIYNAFQDKEHLFIDVLTHYHAPYEAFMGEIFNGDLPAREAVLKLFQASENQHACGNATGCLIVNSGMATHDENSLIGTKLKELHDKNEKLIFNGLKHGQTKGEITDNTNIKKIARYINGIVQGAAVTARGQHSPKAVKDILDQGYQGFLRLLEA